MCAIDLPDLGSWQDWLAEEINQPYFQQIQHFVAQARQKSPVFPPPSQVFRAFHLTSPHTMRVLLLGQDPYHGEGQAHGLSFSVPQGCPLPPSLRNIFKELAADLGQDPPPHGDLSHWASQGVLLLNTVLTVEAHQPHSHRNQGWERFTDAVIQQISDRTDHTVFILWGNEAQRKAKLINGDRHTLLASAHPSPLGAYRGFWGSRPFSQANAALRAHGQPEIQWL